MTEEELGKQNSEELKKQLHGDAEVKENDPEFSKSASGFFDLPAGYLDKDGVLHKKIGLIEMTGEDEDILSSGGGSMLDKLNRVMANCISSIGSITERAEIRKAVAKFCTADRNYLIVAMRRVSLGDDFLMDVTCPRCETVQKMELDLSTLAVDEMPHPLVRIHEVVLPSGKVAIWEVMTGEEEDKLSKIREATQKDMLSFAIMARLRSLDEDTITIGNRLTDARGKLSLDRSGQASFAIVKKMTLRDRNALRDSFTEEEGGVDTEVRYQCEKCKANVEADFNPAQIGFFFPSGV